jgi:RNA 3'-terminal phosphate cyclase (ATP)
MDWQPTSQENLGRSAKRWVMHGGHGVIAAPHRMASANRPWEHRLLSSASARPVILDGSHGEGGGQILRTALSLSLLTGRPFKITKIRANRDKPGLRPQHLKAVEAAAALGHAEAKGAAVGSRELTFRPEPFEPKDLAIDIGTAGATTLVLHTLHLPIALRAQSGVRLVLTGGTFNQKAPSYPFLASTWRSYWAMMGLPVALAMPSAGFFPRGGGQLEAWIEPAQPQPITLLDRPPLARIKGFAGVSHLDPRIADRMKAQAEALLQAEGLTAEIELGEWTAPSPGAALVLTAEHGNIPTTFVGLGERGKPAETVATEAVQELLAFETSAGAVDPHSADQLLLPLALADGRSVFTTSEVTEHLRTNIATIQAFLDRPIALNEFDDGSGRVVVG